MGDYKINIVNLNVTNNYVELTAELEGDRELYYPRISACFYGENDNRILPMDLKSCNKNKAIAIGIFDTPFLFYNNSKIQKEIEKYEMLSDNSPEVGIIRNYIECLMSLPWEISTEDNKDISKKKNVLDNSHYGLNEIKERIIEYIATKDICDKDQSIICFVGPPGVGKTTMAKSIANALNKKFVKISVGGLDDVSEIIGHRKTYIGSYPGKIIQGLKKVKSNNPVFLIDEIDKMNSNNKSNPIASLLDILDKEQNNRFVDNYIEEEFDLSKVMFILTANDLSSIPTEIKDRLEIIELNSYTIEEKESIAEEYIIPSLNKEYNLNLTFSDKVIKEIIIYYTKEAGIRELNRCITNIYRKHITYSYDGNEIEDIKKYLGNYKYKYLYNNKFML